MLDWLNGKKTTIAAIAWPLLTWASSTAIPPEIITIAQYILTAWTGVALGHKVKKKLHE